jgi:hypothetical protein
MTDAPVSEKARFLARGFMAEAKEYSEFNENDIARTIAALESEVRRETVEQCAKVAEESAAITSNHAAYTIGARIRAILDGEAG